MNLKLLVMVFNSFTYKLYITKYKLIKKYVNITDEKGKFLKRRCNNTLKRMEKIEYEAVIFMIVETGDSDLICFS